MEFTSESMAERVKQDLKESVGLFSRNQRKVVKEENETKRTSRAAASVVHTPRSSLSLYENPTPIGWSRKIRVEFEFQLEIETTGQVSKFRRERVELTSEGCE